MIINQSSHIKAENQETYASINDNKLLALHEEEVSFRCDNKGSLLKNKKQIHADYSNNCQNYTQVDSCQNYTQVDSCQNYTQVDSCQNYTQVDSFYKLFSKKIFRTKAYILSTLLFVAFIGLAANFNNIFSDTIITPNFVHISGQNYLRRSTIHDHLFKICSSGNGLKYITIIGPRGSGKTAIAERFAKEYKFDLVWKINASSSKNVLDSFEELVFEIAFKNSDMNFINKMQQITNQKLRQIEIRNYIKNNISIYNNSLLIYDDVNNCKDIKYFLSNNKQIGNGAIIITSSNPEILNRSSLLQENYIEMPELSSEEKMQLFTLILGDKNILNDSEIKDFLLNIPSYPLDITIAAHKINKERMTAAKYLEYLYSGEENFINKQKEILSEIDLYKYTRYEIISLSLDNILKENENNLGLLLVISMFNNQNIPIELLMSIKEEFTVKEFINSLKKYYLTNVDLNNDNGVLEFISLHPYVSSVIRSYLNKKFSKAEIQKGVSKLLENSKNYIIDDEKIRPLA